MRKLAGGFPAAPTDPELPSVWSVRWMLDAFLQASGPNVLAERPYRVALIGCKVIVVKLSLSPDVDGGAVLLMVEDWVLLTPGKHVLLCT